MTLLQSDRSVLRPAQARIISFWRKTAAALLLLLTVGLTTAQAQVVINEILPGATVELKNIGSAAVDISGYYLCDFPAYQNVETSVFQCGGTLLQPGEIAVINDFNTVSAADGELGLYSSPQYSNPSAIVDYVEWGSSGHQRASVAIAAGIWSPGIFAPPLTAGNSLACSGSGDDLSSWTAGAPTICAENTASEECDITTNNITLSGGTTSTVICVDGNADPLTVITNGGTAGTETGWIITDAANDQILALPPSGPFNLDGAGVGVCEIWYVRYEAGNFTGNTVGGNLADLTGCFDLSNPIEVIRQAPDGGTVAAENGATVVTYPAGNVVFEVTHTTVRH